ncbi:hypothetical protein BJY01DRAFT_210016 [Aspergillus pseudoustus]|uniref:Sex determining protein n=1 Tax=Aspergillus pseudoustus TaxID=1810923 RepID=A0ABR4KDH6_9EURO
MYNPWGTHNHGHAHTHAHAHHGQQQQHPHHTNTAPPTAVSSVSTTASRMAALDPSGGGPASHAQSPSQSSYAMSQMRWLPSMSTRSHNHNHNHAAASLPTISSNLRLQHPPHPGQQPQHGHTHAQGQGSVIDVSRAPPPPALVNPGGQAIGVGVGVGVGQTVESVESEESDPSESPGETASGTRDVGGADALGEPEFSGRNGLVGVGGRDEDGDVELLGESTGGNAGKGPNGRPGGMNLTPRKHGKRLTTKEEVSLFEICNRHAAEFGRRSNLCKWWMTVTMEFTRGQKHPYSWHSVRRKVEIVTKQRMKFLEEQRDKGTTEADDLSNPRWRSAVDAWIPTWQRWEEAEARRIEKRDSRRPRKRKWTVTTPTTTLTTDGTWDLTNSGATAPSTDNWQAPSTTSSNSPMVNHAQSHPAPLPPTTSTSATPVRLPPGFDTMFSQPQPQTPSSTTINPQTTHRAQNHTAPPPTAAPDNTMMAAVLETLGKLNKHLDSSSNNNNNSNLTPTTEQPSSQSHQLDSTINSLENGDNTGSGPGLDEIPMATLTRLKEDLRREMLTDLRAEWDKERAVLEEKLDSVQRTQEMILDMLRQEPA